MPMFISKHLVLALDHHLFPQTLFCELCINKRLFVRRYFWLLRLEFDWGTLHQNYTRVVFHVWVRLVNLLLSLIDGVTSAYLSLRCTSTSHSSSFNNDGFDLGLFLRFLNYLWLVWIVWLSCIVRVTREFFTFSFKSFFVFVVVLSLVAPARTSPSTSRCTAS